MGAGAGANSPVEMAGSPRSGPGVGVKSCWPGAVTAAAGGFKQPGSTQRARRRQCKQKPLAQRRSRAEDPAMLVDPSALKN